MTFDDATRAQHIAAQPLQSTWLSANAGSGKTRVLTDRAARLLLEGVAPERILCLTYTKAAATEMQNRLFERLGEWAMLDDAALQEALHEIGAEDTSELDRARTLFASAIETPGGLKIQTIHSFCAAILRRFPVEAGVAPNFKEIDETASQRLVSDLISELAISDHGAVLDDLGQYISDDNYNAIAQEILDNADAFASQPTEDELWRLFDLPPGFDVATLEARAFRSGDAALLQRVRDVCATGSDRDKTAAKKLAPILGRDPGVADLSILCSVLLFAAGAKNPFGAKVGNFPTKASRTALGHDADALDDLMRRVEMARTDHIALSAAQRALALHGFAGAFLPAYRKAKQDRGWLDFDDLIRHTRQLLRTSASAAWVLYKLDGGIDHILVDEAQDTSPGQWDVIAKLAEEMLAGKGRETATGRSVFVVGDKKQSIYSFQGADPAAFDSMADFFDARLQSGRALNRLRLVHSFRSSDAVLRAVDETYDNDPQPEDRHKAYFRDLPGRVDLWPIVASDQSEDPEVWWNPVDLPGANHHSVLLSRQIAGFVRNTIERETLAGSKGRRAINGGDFLILVQSRSTPLFHNIIRALKSEGLPVAGADRLELSAELAVRDLMSLLRFLSLPEDDLALAEVLRSPLFGLTENDLFNLCHGRASYLWAALRAQDSRYPKVVGQLRDLRDASDFLRPYELLERILTTHRGRERLIARLGREAEDGIDLLLNQALRYEDAETPSLTGFLLWLEGGEVTIKRQADQSGQQIRVMTVHGAKGLEAPIVILPDTVKQPRQISKSVLLSDGGIPVWRQGSAQDDAPLIAAAREDAARKDAAERRRLLYVAMTRAEQWLVVCGSGIRVTPPTWHSEIEDSLRRMGAETIVTPSGAGLRYQHGDWSAGLPTETRAPDDTGIPVPKWIDVPVPLPDRAEATLAPSELGGAKVLPGEGHDRDKALAYGSDLHCLLEHLPRHAEADWSAVARTLLGCGDTEALLDAAGRLLKDPTLEWLFLAESLAEVPVSATLAELDGRRIAGAIDRLVIRPDRIIAVDFKSNLKVPDDPMSVPEGLLRQMGAYAAALSRIFRNRTIEVGILWTRTGTYMALPNDLVIGSLAGSSPP